MLRRNCGPPHSQRLLESLEQSPCKVPGGEVEAGLGSQDSKPKDMKEVSFFDFFFPGERFFYLFERVREE